MIELRGVSWDHPRGHDCMVATAEAYAAANPGVRIAWEPRSLQAFADEPVERLARRYDLLVIDHPFVGFAAAVGCLLPLDERIGAAYLDDQAANSVGPSHRSYHYGGHQWALATDAAGHVAAYRPDLVEAIGGVPRTWDDVLRLAAARRGQPTARIALPLIPVDALMSFCSLCAAHGEGPFAGPDRVVGRPLGRHALETLRALREACHPASLRRNPPRLLDLMGTTDEIAFVPLLFGYSNYARPGFRPKLIRFGPVPVAAGHPPGGGILGGAGLAVSATTAHPAVAADYAAYVGSAEVQRGVYFAAGGQPGHRAAWLDGAVNAAASDFFRDTLDTLDRAYLRPRYDGFLAVQERAGELIHAWLTEGGRPDPLLDALDALYRGSDPPGEE
jgi:multiple sugar transport system substrate-binding protein